MDGVSEVREIVRAAYEWGMPAVAITDHGVVHAFPDANHERQDLWKSHKKKCEKAGEDPGRYEDFFKVIYGMEGYLRGEALNIVYDLDDDYTINSKFVVFDIETTGFSAVDNKIIEIGAVKIENGEIEP